MPKRFTSSQIQYLACKAKPFVLRDVVLYRFGQDNKFSCFATKTCTNYITRINSGVRGGHFSLDITTRKIIHANYWWPTKP